MSRNKKIIIFCASLIILAYLLFRNGVIFSKYSNLLANLLFDIISIFSSIVIAYIVSIDISTKQQKENQKKLAKTYIRHIRTQISTLIKLPKIIDKKLENTEEELLKQYFEEIKNHINNVTGGIIAAEDDFKDLLDDEFREENKLSPQVIELYNELEEKNRELKTSTKEVLVPLKEDIKKLKSDIIALKGKFPIGGYAASSGSVSVNVADMLANYNPNSAMLFDTSLLFKPVIAQNSILVDQDPTRISTEDLKGKEKKKSK